MHNKIMDKKDNFLLFFLCAGAVGVVNGLFGGGGGLFCVPILKSLMDMDDKTAHSNTVFIMAIISLPTLIIYLFSLEYSMSCNILVSIGSLIGGSFGNFFLSKISNRLLNVLFIIVIILSGIKILV